MMFNWIVSDTQQYLKPFNCIQKNELMRSFKKLSTKYVYKSYIFNIYV